MFQLHETLKRRICRILFVACCVLPTGGVGAWAVLVHLPQYKAAYERALGERLGMRVSIARVTMPRPGELLFAGVELKDRETGAPLGRARLVEAWQDGGIWNVQASQPELNDACLRALAGCLENRLRDPSADDAAFRFAAAEAKLDTIAAQRSLVDVQFEHVQPGQAAVSFRVADLKMPAPAELQIARNRGDNVPSTRYEFTTGESALPCSLFTAAWPALARLGPRATLRGRVSVQAAPGGCEGEVVGQIASIELASLVNDQFPHQLGGSALLTLTRAHFADGRLEEAAGTLVAGPGIVGRSLLAAAEKHLHLAKVSEPQTATQSLRYEQLGIAFTVERRGLTIRSACQDAPRAILTDGPRTLLAEPAEPFQPVVNLVRTLVPQSEVLVPATRETDRLTQILPVPAVMLPEGVPPTATRIRIGKGTSEK